MRFYFDYISPYAYLAWRQLPALAAAHGEPIEPVPILFGAVLGAHGTRGPAEVPAKRTYLIHDVARKAKLAGIPFALPPAHPFNPLAALRATWVPMPDSDRTRLIDALFKATWETGTGIEGPAALSQVAFSAGLDGAALAQASGEVPAKDALRNATEAAIADGIFGVPTMAVGPEQFWGVDALPALAAFLADRQPVDAALVKRWASLPATARRI